MTEQIPFNRAWISGQEMNYLREVIESGQISSDGPFTRRCAELLEQRFGLSRVLMTPSCTAALEMAIMLCDVGPGDEVILPSYTFVSTALAVARLRSDIEFGSLGRGVSDRTSYQSAVACPLRGNCLRYECIGQAGGGPRVVCD